MLIKITLPAELVNAIDKLRGDVPRSRWIRRQLEQAVKAIKGEQ